MHLLNNVKVKINIVLVEKKLTITKDINLKNVNENQYTDVTNAAFDFDNCR